MEKKKNNSIKKKRNLSAKSRKKINKKEKGFTLVELLAVIVVLAIVIGIASASFIGVKNKTLQGDYENIVSLLETKAANYAKKTGITTISVEDLILAGEISPDDETDLYNPVNKKSLNCYILKSEYKDGEYVSTLIEKDNRDRNNKCTEYEKTEDYVICEYNKATNKCVEVSNGWKNDNITLALQKRNGELVLNSEGNNYIWAWTSTSGQTGNEEMFTTNESLASKNTYRVQVTMEDKIAEASAEIAIDKEAPMISNVKMDDKWEKEKTIEIEVNDFNGSGVKGVSIGTSNVCPTQTTAYNITPQNNVVKTKRTKNETIYVCAMDNVGNISPEAKEIVVTKVDSKAVEDGDIKLVASTTDWVKELTITGTAIDRESGLVEYAFTINNTNNPTWQKLDEAPTNQMISKSLNITENGTYYFWVKDLVGNEERVSITINNVDLEIDSINLTKSTTDWTNSLTITGTATDNKSGIVAYQFNQSANTPTGNWISVSKTNSLSKQQNVTKDGTYYFWVKDAVGNIDKKSVNVDNIGTVDTITFETDEIESRTYSGSRRISGIKKILNVQVNTGTISNTSVSNGIFYFSVSNGRQIPSTKYEYFEIYPYSVYPASQDVEYQCPSGTYPYGGYCLYYCPNADGYDVTYECTCSNSKWNCHNTSGPLDSAGYADSGDRCSYGCSRSGVVSNGLEHKQDQTCSNNGATETGTTHGVMSCTSNSTVYPTPTYGDYYCSRGGDLDYWSLTCSICSKGSYSNGWCSGYDTISYTYYKYSITVNYIKSN